MPHLLSLVSYRPTIIEVDLSILNENIKSIQNILKKCELLAVVKANATGHGIVPISQTLIKAGVRRLGVTTVEEGAELRENGIHVPIHIISSISPSQAFDVVNYNLTASVSTLNLAEAISTAATVNHKNISVHLKIDTGLHRFGVDPSEAIQFCKTCYHLPGLQWEGVYTHFSGADVEDWETTEKEYALYNKVVAALLEQGFTFPIHHVGGSAIAMQRPDMYMDMLRIGIALFGYPPIQSDERNIVLKPIMTLKSEIIHLREFPAETPIGYGGNYVTSSTEKIAIIPIGHGDGYKRALAKRGEMLVNGKRVKVIGAISLDQTLIDVTHIPNVAVGDEVVLLGPQKDDEITALEIANWMDSTVDEVLGSWMARIQRVYV